jgi:hypothetical protein
MDALDYLKKYGRGRAEKVSVDAGTTMAYFEQLAYGFRRPSYDLAERLVKASEGEMDTPSLMQAKARIQAGREGAAA